MNNIQWMGSNPPPFNLNSCNNKDSAIRRSFVYFHPYSTESWQDFVIAWQRPVIEDVQRFGSNSGFWRLLSYRPPHLLFKKLDLMAYRDMLHSRIKNLCKSACHICKQKAKEAQNGSRDLTTSTLENMKPRSSTRLGRTSVCCDKQLWIW